MKQIILKQGYAAPSLKSSLQKLYGRDHEQVDRYEISISQMMIDIFPFTYHFYFHFFPLSALSYFYLKLNKQARKYQRGNQ